MKKLIIAALAAASFVAIAQEAPKAGPARPADVRAGRQLTPPGLRTNSNVRFTFPEITGSHVLIVSASGKVGAEMLGKARDSLMMMLRMPIKTDVRSFDGCAVEYAEKALAEGNVAAVVVVKDDPRAPSLVSLPEKKIAVINPLAYCPEGTSGELVESRMTKMIQRGYCAVMGATLAPVFSAEDLDALKGGVAPSALTSIFRYAKALGMNRITPIALDQETQVQETATTNAPAAKAE